MGELVALVLLVAFVASVIRLLITGVVLLAHRAATSRSERRTNDLNRNHTRMNAHPPEGSELEA